MTDNPIAIDGLGIRPIETAGKTVWRGASGESSGVSFQEVLRDSIRDVDRLQTDAETAIKKMSVGESESAVEVMTAVEKADIAFRTLMKVRNKLVDAYEELVRMRV